MLELDPEKASKKLEGVDAILDGVKKILKKHWGILLILLFLYGCYALVMDISNDPDVPVETEVANPKVKMQHVDDGKPYITKETYIIDQKYRIGDTVYVDYYSDGYIEKYYIRDNVTYPPK